MVNKGPKSFIFAKPFRLRQINNRKKIK